MPYRDFTDVSYGERGGDQRSFLQPGVMSDIDFNKDYFTAKQSSCDVRKTNDMDTFTLHKEPVDELLYCYNEEAINSPITELYPHLSANQETFVQQALLNLQKFATEFPGNTANQPLDELLKQFNGGLKDPKVIDAINYMMNKWYERNPNEYRVRLGQSEITGEIYLGLPDPKAGRFDPVFKLNGTAGERLLPG